VHILLLLIWGFEFVDLLIRISNPVDEYKGQENSITNTTTALAPSEGQRTIPLGQRSSWKADLVKKLPAFYGTRKIHYHVYKFPPLDPVMNHLNQVAYTFSHPAYLIS
jgi:hypothetical protein